MGDVWQEALKNGIVVAVPMGVDVSRWLRFAGIARDFHKARLPLVDWDVAQLLGVKIQTARKYIRELADLESGTWRWPTSTDILANARFQRGGDYYNHHVLLPQEAMG